MNIEALKKLITQGESETLEFKKSTAQLHAAFETVCAFLNGSGGIVLIGVTDAGKIVGQTFSDETKREIAREISKIEPATQLNVHYINYQKNKKVIVLEVKKGSHAPYIYDHRPYQRHQSSTTRITQHQYEQMIVARGQLNHSWESQINDKCDLNSLDHEKIYQVVAIAVDKARIPASALNSKVHDILARYTLVEGEQVKNAAVVLFAKEEALNLPQCVIKMARFRGKDKFGEMLDSKHVYANAITMLDEADLFIRKHLLISSFFDKNQFERIDKPTLPMLAVREALVNAIAHRDYSVHSGSITLAIYDDKMVIWNNGTLPKQLTIEDLSKNHFSWAQNPLIARVFHSMKLIETWGTGTNKMINLCREDGLPDPEFKEEFGGLSVTFKFKTSIGISPSSEDPSQTHLIKGLTPKERKEKIIALLTNQGRLSAREIHHKLSIAVSFRTIKSDLLALQQEHVIKQVGQGKNTLWEINILD